MLTAVQRGMRLGVGGDRLQPYKLNNAEIIPNGIPSANAVGGDGTSNPENRMTKHLPLCYPV